MIIEKERPGTVGAVHGLKSEAIKHHRPQDNEAGKDRQAEVTKNWLLHRFRSAYSGAGLVQGRIEELGKNLAAGRIGIEQAASDLNAIEETPLLYLSSLLTPEYGEVA